MSDSIDEKQRAESLTQALAGFQARAAEIDEAFSSDHLQGNDKTFSHETQEEKKARAGFYASRLMAWQQLFDDISKETSALRHVELKDSEALTSAAHQLKQYKVTIANKKDNTWKTLKKISGLKEIAEEQVSGLGEATPGSEPELRLKAWKFVLQKLQKKETVDIQVQADGSLVMNNL